MNNQVNNIVVLGKKDEITLDSRLKMPGANQRPLPVRRLVALEAADGYCHLVIDGGEKPILLSRSLSWMERRLSQLPLVRVSKYHLVRLDRIVHFENGLVLMDTQQTFPVSRQLIHPVQLALDKWQHTHPR